MRRITTHSMSLLGTLLTFLLPDCAPTATQDSSQDIPQSKPGPVSYVDTAPDRLVRLDYAKIRETARRGAEWLRDQWGKELPLASREIPGVLPEGAGMNELTLLACSRWDALDMSSEKASTQIAAIRASPPATTFDAAVRSMLFNKLPPFLQGNIVQCVQYLVDTQGQDGSWGAGKAIPLPPVSVRDEKVGWPRLTVAVVRVRRRAWGELGNLTNTVWAINGLIHACGAGVFPPSDCMAAINKRLSDTQNDDGGWGKSAGEPSECLATATGMWSLAIALRLNGMMSPRNDPRVQRAVQWLDADIERHPLPQRGDVRAFFCIYMLGQTAEIPGGRELKTLKTDYWKEKIVDWLLGMQNSNGSWGDEDSDRVFCSCLALLVLPTGGRINWWIPPDYTPKPR